MTTWRRSGGGGGCQRVHSNGAGIYNVLSGESTVAVGESQRPTKSESSSVSIRGNNVSGLTL